MRATDAELAYTYQLMDGLQVWQSCHWKLLLPPMPV